MSAPADRATRRPPRAAGVLARLVLAVVPMLMGSAVGQWLQGRIVPDGGTPYEGALLLATAGLIMGLALAWRGTRAQGWRRAVADVTLCLLAVVWLLGMMLRAAGELPPEDLAAAWAAALAGVVVVSALGR